MDGLGVWISKTICVKADQDSSGTHNHCRSVRMRSKRAQS